MIGWRAHSSKCSVDCWLLTVFLQDTLADNFEDEKRLRRFLLADTNRARSILPVDRLAGTMKNDRLISLLSAGYSILPVSYGYKYLHFLNLDLQEIFYSYTEHYSSPKLILVSSKIVSLATDYKIQILHYKVQILYGVYTKYLFTV